MQFMGGKMELIKKNIHANVRKAKAVTQITLDEDINVPDSCEDIEKIVQEKACFKLDEVKSGDNQAMIRGTMLIDVLYTSGEDGSMQVMHGKVPVEDVIHIEGITGMDMVNVRTELEEVSVSLINSRKINLKGIISVYAFVDDWKDEEILVEIKDESKAVQTLEKELSLLKICTHKKDNCRIKDEIVLSSAKPNIYQLVWYQIQPCNVEIKKMDGQLSVHGDLKLLILYAAEEENRPIQVIEENIPFHNTLECTGCQEHMVSQIQWEMCQGNVEVRPDSDGEERIFTIEAMLEMEMYLYEEENVQVLADAYSTAKKLTPVQKQLECHKLLIKNQSKSRVEGTLSIDKKQPRILQVFQAGGVVHADDVQITEDGLLVEGVVSVQLLYVTADDAMPYASMKGQIPFRQLVEVPDMEADAEYMIQADVEQLQAMMSDSEEVEIKGSINLHVLVLGHEAIQVIKDVTVEEPDYERLSDIPGMTGYIAKEGDTLWDIAKEYSTTVEILRQMNDFHETNVKRGDKFLIMKQVV